MILECPACHARYMVPIGLFAQGGREVRCARCKNQWRASLPTHIDVFTSLPPPQPEPVESTVSSRATSPSAPLSDVSQPVSASHLPAVIREWRPAWFRHFAGIGKTVPYIAAGLGLAVLLIWPILDRQQIVKVLPELRDYYDALGLDIDHSNRGLTFGQVKSELRYEGGAMHLNVDGVIHNATSDAQLIPDIKANALGADKKIIQSWWVQPPAATVAAGSDLPFHTEVTAPMKSTIEDVSLEFQAQDEKGDVSH
jgi:predicted Zn finger-like uncharacterized protein